jgi:hypothetical protein
MKLVVNGYAGAGTVTMGGFDYHTGARMLRLKPPALQQQKT